MSGNKKKRTFIHYLPIYGCISTGIIYIIVGVIAILSFLKIMDGGADENSMLAVLNDFLVGKIFIWIILLGIVSYIVWRLYETAADPYGYGKEMKGFSKRAGIAFSTIPDALIAYAAVRVLLGVSNIQINGEPDEEREMADNILQLNFGHWLVSSIGVILLITAVLQFVYGVTRGYKERLDIDHFYAFVKKMIHFAAWVGYLARGIIIGITGFFLIKAGIMKDASYVVNTDKAFDFIGDNVGHLYFILVAIGTICYGFFMFAQGIAYDTDKD